MRDLAGITAELLAKRHGHGIHQVCTARLDDVVEFARFRSEGFRKSAQGGEKVSPLWLVGAYFIEELGELSLSPVGLSVVTKLAPTRIVGLLMGVWFLSNALGNKLAGWSAGFISTLPLPTLFGTTAAVTLGAAVGMALLIKPVRRLMGGVH